MALSRLDNLDVTVISALEHFSSHQPQPLSLGDTNWSIIVGSGNAYNTGLVIFGQKPAVIVNESGFKEAIKSHRPLIKSGAIQQAIIISASGEKDSVWETKLAHKASLKTHLITCNENSTAAGLADQVTVYERLPEPYTYNVSTYLGIILGASREKAGRILSFLKKVSLPRLTDFQAYAFILPDRFAAIAPMLEIKRHELFGPHISLRAFSEGEARHAKFVNSWDKELVISFGPNKYFGEPKSRQEIKLPRWADNGLVMALAYFLIGKIQAAKPPYFRRNIEKYCLIGPRAYGHRKPFDIIVK